jgi:hypothetical protein
MTSLKLLLISTLLLLVSACGGGGGGSSGPVASSNSFDIRAGATRLAASGSSKTLTISGTCSGTFSLTRSPATSSTTFEGKAALSGSSVGTANFSNCTPASNVGTATYYYDSNYVPLGYATVGGNYAVWASTPTFPVAAKVGDVAVVGTVNLYTNSSKTTPAGTEEHSYVIEADTATTAIVNLIIKSYTTSHVLTDTEQDRYRVAADGSLSLISIDIQYANGSTTHLVMN